MEVALYVRVSTNRQQQQQTIEQQLTRLREHIAMQPDWHLADEHIYRDDGYSGAKLNRPGLDRMRRGRQAKVRSGLLLPWTVPPYGYLLDPECPRDPSRLRLDPVKAAVVTHIFAWYTEPQTPSTLYGVAKRLSDAQLPTPMGTPRWNASSVRGMLCNAVSTGIAHSGKSRPVPARQRQSARRPVGPGVSHRPTPPEDWAPIPVPAIMSPAIFDAAQARLERKSRTARRNNTVYAYLLRGLVSCGQCQLACTGRTSQSGSSYYWCRGRTDPLRAALGERCIARYIRAHALDALVWQDLCQVLTQPALITHELQRAQGGEWLPQALQARQRTLREALAQIERQHARLLDVSLAEVIGREECERKRHELAQTQQSVSQQLRYIEAQAQQQVDVLALAQGIDAFCHRLGPTLDHLTFTQRRQLVELLIDRVIVNDGQVEIRYVVPTGPKGETVPFCHLRLDYFDGPPHPAHPHLGCQSGVHWGMAQIRLQLACLEVPTPHQPDVRTGQGVPHGGHPHGGTLRHHGPLAAFLDRLARPRHGGQRGGHLPYGARRWRACHQALPPWAASAPTPRRGACGRALLPDPRGMGHFSTIPQAQPRHAIQQARLASACLIRHHPAAPQALGLHHRSEHLLGQRWLGFERHLGWKAALCTSLRIRGVCDPLHRPIQPAIQDS